MLIKKRNIDLFNIFIGLIISSCFFFFPVEALALTGREIMQQVLDRDDGDDGTSDMEMVLIDKKGRQRIRKMRSFSKDFGEDTYSVIFFLAPADVKNTGFLTYDYKKSGKDDDQWLYLPALRKNKRIASSDKSGSFMGSDFNYSDMTETDLDDFNYKLMKEVAVEDHKTWQIEVLPKNDDVADDTGYSKSIVFVRQDNYVPIRGVKWVYKSKKMKYMKVNKMKVIDNIWVVTDSQMATKQGRKTVHSTILRISNVKFNQDLKEEFFALRQLEKGL
tara:strand:- start:800 stop:1624 length:825 start_codon:yes stop_codon:yes gene_type:complete